MMKKFVYLILFLFVSQMAMADYVLISGSNDTNGSTQSIIRYRDDFVVVWERSPAAGTPEPLVNDVVINPLEFIYGGGDVYTAHYGFAPPDGLVGKHFDWETGDYIGRPVPSSLGDGQADGTGTYTPRGNVLQDIQFGHDYNGDGVKDLWIARRDFFEVYDGTTLDRTGDDGVADILTWLDIPDSVEGTRDGTGAFGFCFGLDVTGDGIGELYAMRGINQSTGSRLNIWNPVTMTQVATYNVDGIRDNTYMILGPDVNDDGQQDLWVADSRSHRIRALDCATGEVVAGEVSFVDASNPNTDVTLRYPSHINDGPDGSILVTTRFATSLDPDWTGPSDITGGNLLKIVWDPENQRGLATLLFEHSRRLSGVAYKPIDLKKAHFPFPLNKAKDMTRDVVLSWTPGLNTGKHDVYLGNDFNDVNEAGIADPRGVLVSQNQDDAAYDPPGLLEWDRTYYWRIDEVNDVESNSPWKGNVWSFTTANYIVIEDFEDYNDYQPNTVFDTWIDGFDDPANGSTAGYPDPAFFSGEHYLEDEIVHGGNWSMPLFYDNSAGLSEVTRTLTSALRDWAQNGFITLSLWYYGDTDNTAELMYVALNGSVVVTNDDLNAALVTEWTRWDIPLQAFAEQGMNLADVNTISIGLGNKNNPVAGGSGTMYFDDIRLYQPASEPEPSP